MTTVELCWVCTDGARMPTMPGPWFRGRLGSALRNIVCSTGLPTCDDCDRRSLCTYGAIWEPERRADLPPWLKAPPPPYVVQVEMVDADASIAPGDRFGCRVHLFAHARSHVPAVIAAAVDGGRYGFGAEPAYHVKAELEYADVVAPSDQRQRLYEQGTGFSEIARIPYWDLVEACDEGGDAERADAPVAVWFLTPTSLPVGHRGVVRRFDPIALTNTLIERAAALSAAWEGVTPGWNKERYLDAATHAIVDDDATFVRTSVHHSARGLSREQTGLLGGAVVSNVHPRLLALWQLAQFIHVGRDAAYGFGRIALGPPDALFTNIED